MALQRPGKRVWLDRPTLAGVGLVLYTIGVSAGVTESTAQCYRLLTFGHRDDGALKTQAVADWQPIQIQVSESSLCL